MPTELGRIAQVGPPCATRRGHGACHHACRGYIQEKEKDGAPVESELLTVRIKGYTDDVQVLDTTRLMRSFYAKELIMPDNYMFHVSF